MAAKVHGDDPMTSAEARDLLTPKTPITRRAMHEHEGRITASGVVVRQHTITNQIHHPPSCHVCTQTRAPPTDPSRVTAGLEGTRRRSRNARIPGTRPVAPRDSSKQQ